MRKYFSIFSMLLLLIFCLTACISLNFNNGSPDEYGVVEYETKPTSEHDVTDTVESVIETELSSKQKDFIINKTSLKFHSENCHYVNFMNEENKEYITSTYDELIHQGYKACAICQS